MPARTLIRAVAAACSVAFAAAAGAQSAPSASRAVAPRTVATYHMSTRNHDRTMPATVVLADSAGQLVADHGPEEGVRQLEHDPGPVARVGVGAGGTPVLEPLERVERPPDHPVRRLGVEPRDEGEAARVVLERGVVQPLRLHRIPLSPMRLLVRRGERRAGPASRVAGARP